MKKTIFIVIALLFVTIGFTVPTIYAHRKTKQIEATKQIDFAKSIEQFKALKSTVPVALISNQNHVLVLDKSGNTMLYCSTATTCEGVSGKNLQKAIYDLFISMAQRSRDEQAQAAKRAQPPTGSFAPVPPQRPVNQQSGKNGNQAPKK